MRPVWMKNRLVSFVLVIALVATVACADASGRTAEEAARELAALAVEIGTLEMTLDRGASTGWDASIDVLTLELGRELTAEENTRGRQIIRDVLGEFVTPEIWMESVTRVYSENFTADELDGIAEFYGSPLGRKVLTMDATFTEAVDARMEEVLGPRTDDLVNEIDEAIAVEFGLDASEGGA